MASGTTSKFAWTVLFVVIIPLIGYALYSGLTVGKIQLPGGFVIEFREAPTPVQAENRIDELSQDELESRQAELEQKLAEMEAQLQRAPESDVQIAQVTDVSGTWQSPNGLSYTIVQQGLQLTIQEINPYYGITAVGEGNIMENTVSINYRTAANTFGTGTLRLSNNGTRLSGSFVDSYSGVQTPADLQKVGR